MELGVGLLLFIIGARLATRFAPRMSSAERLSRAEQMMWMAGIFFAGALLDAAADIYLSTPWLALRLRGPVADWMIHNGLGRLAGYWGMLWIHGPIYLTAFLGGLAIASTRETNRVALALSFSLGMVVYEIGSQMYFWYVPPGAGSSVVLFLLLVPWKVIAIPTALIPVWWSRRRPTRRPIAAAAS